MNGTGRGRVVQYAILGFVLVAICEIFGFVLFSRHRPNIWVEKETRIASKTASEKAWTPESQVESQEPEDVEREYGHGMRAVFRAKSGPQRCHNEFSCYIAEVVLDTLKPRILVVFLGLLAGDIPVEPENILPAGDIHRSTRPYVRFIDLIDIYTNSSLRIDNQKRLKHMVHARLTTPHDLRADKLEKQRSEKRKKSGFSLTSKKCTPLKHTNSLNAAYESTTYECDMGESHAEYYKIIDSPDISEISVDIITPPEKGETRVHSTPFGVNRTNGFGAGLMSYTNRKMTQKTDIRSNPAMFSHSVRGVSACITGVDFRQPYWREIIMVYQFMSFSHVYIAVPFLKTHWFFQQMAVTLSDWIEEGFVSLVPSVYTQVAMTPMKNDLFWTYRPHGHKSAYYNACILNARNHRDDFVWIADMDEFPIFNTPYESCKRGGFPDGERRFCCPHTCQACGKHTCGKGDQYKKCCPQNYVRKCRKDSRPPCHATPTQSKISTPKLENVDISRKIEELLKARDLLPWDVCMINLRYRFAFGGDKCQSDKSPNDLSSSTLGRRFPCYFDANTRYDYGKSFISTRRTTRTGVHMGANCEGLDWDFIQGFPIHNKTHRFEEGHRRRGIVIPTHNEMAALHFVSLKESRVMESWGNNHTKVHDYTSLWATEVYKTFDWRNRIWKKVNADKLKHFEDISAGFDMFQPIERCDKPFGCPKSTQLSPYSSKQDASSSTLLTRWPGNPKASDLETT